MRLIYLDYNSTTPLAGAAREAMLPFLYEFYGSPSSSHWTGAAVAEALEDARTNVAALLDCEAHEVIFTSGGTEAVNTAIRSGLNAMRHTHGRDTQLLLTNWEHCAAHTVAADLAREQATVLVASGGSMGGWEPESIVTAIGDRPTFLTLTLGDGETGIVQPVAKLFELLRASGRRDQCVVHLDCCQAIGKADIAAELLEADLISISGHKMYAAKGVGALVVRNEVVQAPLINGEWYERGIRNGTPNVPGIVGLGAAAELMAKSYRRFESRCTQLFQVFDASTRQCLGEVFAPLASSDSVLCNTRLFLTKGKNASAVMQRLPEICVKCFGNVMSDVIDEDYEVESDPSVPTIAPIAEMDEATFDSLRAGGVSESDRLTAVRLSIGWNTTEADLTKAAEAISEAYQQSDLD